MSSKKPDMRGTTPRQKGVKNVLKSPFILKWPVVSAAVKAEFSEELQKSLSDVVRKNAKERRRKPRGKKADARTKASASSKKTPRKLEQVDQPTTSSSPQSPSPPFNSRKRQCLSVGLKETVRCLERGVLMGGVLCLSSCPVDLQAWLLGMVAARGGGSEGGGGVHFVGLYDAGPLLARLLGVASVMVLGVRSGEGPREVLPRLCSLLESRAPCITAPWIAAKCGNNSSNSSSSNGSEGTTTTATTGISGVAADSVAPTTPTPTTVATDHQLYGNPPPVRIAIPDAVTTVSTETTTTSSTANSRGGVRMVEEEGTSSQRGQQQATYGTGGVGRKRAWKPPHSSPGAGREGSHGHPPAKRAAGSPSGRGNFKSPSPAPTSGLLTSLLSTTTAAAATATTTTTKENESAAANKRLSFSPIYQAANVARIPIFPKPPGKSQRKKQTKR